MEKAAGDRDGRNIPLEINEMKHKARERKKTETEIGRQEGKT